MYSCMQLIACINSSCDYPFLLPEFLTFHSTHPNFVNKVTFLKNSITPKSDFFVNNSKKCKVPKWSRRISYSSIEKVLRENFCLIKTSIKWRCIHFFKWFMTQKWDFTSSQFHFFNFILIKTSSIFRFNHCN